MSATRTRVPDDVIPILRRSTFAGNVLTLPEQLDRETYLRVAKVLTAARGKWDRKAKGHVFPFDPRELIGEAVEDGVVVDAKRTLQFFETPDDLAERMVGLSGIGAGEIALEPSAGLGRIVRHLIARGAMVDAVEIDPENCKALRAIPDIRCVSEQDFLEYAKVDAAQYDAVVMNPPFANNQDIKHIRAAWQFVRPGGRLVAICSEGPFFRQDGTAKEFREWLEEIGADAVKLPDDTFRESGTGVATRLIFATKAAGPAPSGTEENRGHRLRHSDEPNRTRPRPASQDVRADRAPRTRRLHPGGRPATAHRRAALDHGPHPLHDLSRRATLARPPDQRRRDDPGIRDDTERYDHGPRHADHRERSAAGRHPA